MPEERAPFHPLRFVDLFIENWWKAVVFFATLFGSIWLGVVVFETTGNPWLFFVVVLLALAAESLIIPRWTMYGYPVGVRTNGWIYRRHIAPRFQRRDEDG